MKTTIEIMVVVGALFASAAWAQIESNDSLEVLTNAEAQVQLKLEQFAKTSANYDLLLEALKISASLNPRGDNKTTLSPFDEGCLQLQLKVLLALNKARDPHYDRNAWTNAVFMNLVPPLPDTNGVWYPSGADPNDIKDSKARKAYEDVIAENNRRGEKAKREMALSRGVDYALINIWVFVKRGLDKNSTAQERAIEIVAKTLPEKTLRDRFDANDMPGLTW